ncbi:hypothetical protein [Streptomyces sp. NPDC088725]|uniref:hypothetical protein n=1 Tax=Streptomyces sp. NPDC088725 TaxID=3365873 RepID=UPI0038250940
MTVHDVAGMLPDIPSLRDLCRSIAMAEAVLNPDGERYYAFNANWSETDELASMRDGSGDEFDVVFSPAGAYTRGFDHASPLTPYLQDDVPTPWPGVVDAVPDVFRHLVDEPAFTDEDGTPVVTVCLWRQPGDERWLAATSTRSLSGVAGRRKGRRPVRRIHSARSRWSAPPVGRCAASPVGRSAAPASESVNEAHSGSASSRPSDSSSASRRPGGHSSSMPRSPLRSRASESIVAWVSRVGGRRPARVTTLSYRAGASR